MNTTKQKVIVITGAGSGIGRETALLFLENGYKVALAGRNQITLNETISQSKNMLLTHWLYQQTLPIKNLFKTCLKK